MFPELTLPQSIAVAAIPILLAITLHEVAHGWVADKLGDHTARALGRLTINPLRHIDPLGTVVVPILLLTLGGFLFGWAKPVPVDARNLKQPKRDMAIVAAAGPIANLLMAIVWLGVGHLGASFTQGIAPSFLVYMSFFGVFINLVLLVLNLIPIPPLDGSRVVSSFLPPRWEYNYNRIEPYGFFILVAMIATGALQSIMGPPLNYLLTLFFSSF